MIPLGLLLRSSGSAIFMTLLTVAVLSCLAGPVYANRLHQRGRIVAAARIAERSAWGAYALAVAGAALWVLVATGVLVLQVKAKR